SRFVSCRKISIVKLFVLMRKSPCSFFPSDHKSKKLPVILVRVFHLSSMARRRTSFRSDGTAVSQMNRLTTPPFLQFKQVSKIFPWQYGQTAYGIARFKSP